MSAVETSSIEELLKRREEILKQRNLARLIAKRKALIKRKKPEFLRHLWWKFIKFQNDLKWKRPRGKDNKMRLKLKGYPPVVSAGYGTPDELRYLHPSGLIPVTVSSVKDLEKLDPKKHIVYIASTVGLKKRLELVKVAQEKGFKVANP